MNHGYNGYAGGCRCDTCRAAKAAYMSARRKTARRNARTGWVAGGVKTHGTRAAYEEHGCRCGQCTATRRRAWRIWSQQARSAS